MPSFSRLVRPALAIGLATTLAARDARAHGIAPVLLEISLRADGTASVLWKTAASRPRGANLEPVLPERCRLVGNPVAGTTAEGVMRSQEVDCGPQGLVGATVSVRDLDVARTDALLRIALPDGREIRTVLRGDRPDFVVPRPLAGADAFARGARSGLSRLSARADVLLFLVCLVLLSRDQRALALAVCAFIVGNSVTLLAAALGAIDPTPPLADFLVAASVVAIAADLARGDSSTPNRSAPWVPAAILGLVHGLAHAPGPLGAFRGEEPGPITLLGYHLGLEASVVLFAAIAWAARVGTRAGLRRLAASDLPAEIARATAYTVGCAASFLAIECAARLLG